MNLVLSISFTEQYAFFFFILYLNFKVAYKSYISLFLDAFYMFYNTQGISPLKRRNIKGVAQSDLEKAEESNSVYYGTPYTVGVPVKSKVHI